MRSVSLFVNLLMSDMSQLKRKWIIDQHNSVPAALFEVRIR